MVSEVRSLGKLRLLSYNVKCFAVHFEGYSLHNKHLICCLRSALRKLINGGLFCKHIHNIVEGEHSHMNTNYFINSYHLKV